MLSISDIKQLTFPIFSKYPIKKVGVFGSHARGEATTESDVDFVVELERPMGLSFYRMQDELEMALGRSVDLGTLKSLKPQVRHTAQKDLQIVYGS